MTSDPITADLDDGRLAQCGGKTLKGTRCRRLAPAWWRFSTHGIWFCRRHLGGSL